MRKLFVTTVLAFLSLAACAADKNAVVMHGFDKMSCADWMSSRFNDAVRDRYIAWIRGIVTGYNYANPEEQVSTGRMPDDFSLGLYVDRYCRDRPTISFAGAAFALIDDVRAKRSEPDTATDRDDLEFQRWLKRQSADLQSLDIDIQHDIYKKEQERRN